MGKEKQESKTLGQNIKEYAILLVIALAIAMIFRTFVFARANVDGPSMMPTFKDKDVIFVEKLSLYTHSIKRGEIVTFYSGDAENNIYIKRVIGLAGDVIEIKDGKVYVNGTAIKEDYLAANTYTQGGDFLAENTKYKVPAGDIFVLGDNRPVSKDSRYIGPVSLKSLYGHVIFRAYPFSSMKKF
ncbi:Signal peptidase I S [Clostridium felsineum]|uniref:Signal peptidase I n=2 Tax=Clostridium felsineum TaxID=36839 RepID=A0A1S8KZG8_9CLOT|nr:signal peptidase I [Clostridium felsineum]URZ04163.1 Signal peptidase I S [Clostridium felsineum]URZ07647.1 Signal peptidase I S [Clostridium felsineum]URZ12678.1 Signal peptidase I S [Clostridium felsineum]URZ17321.1 Signal peptidase I S [Clostridium felsineum DSM 794]